MGSVYTVHVHHQSVLWRNLLSKVRKLKLQTSESIHIFHIFHLVIQWNCLFSSDGWLNRVTKAFPWLTEIYNQFYPRCYALWQFLFVYILKDLFSLTTLFRLFISYLLPTQNAHSRFNFRLVFIPKILWNNQSLDDELVQSGIFSKNCLFVRENDLVSKLQTIEA